MRAVVLAAAAVLLVSLPSGVVAHSLLLDSSPAAGATVPPPARLALRFNNRVEQSLSRLRLVDARGVARPLTVLAGAGRVDHLEAAVPPLPPGVYRVEWQVLSTDGHIVVGRFSFRVAP